MRNNKKGFTLIELLVVIAIIGLLSTLAVIALNNARGKARDAKRISDVKQLQSALELYYNDAAGYPDDDSELGGECLGYRSSDTANSGFQATCVTDATIYMNIVPTAPTPPIGNVYNFDASDNLSDYSLTFTLEGGAGGLGACAHTATPGGISLDPDCS